ncbi:MAG: hypothetical protein ACLU1W_03205 [Collinsella sp.]
MKKDDNTPIVPKCGEFTFDVYEGNLTAEQLAGSPSDRTNGADGSVARRLLLREAGHAQYTIVGGRGSGLRDLRRRGAPCRGDGC